MKRAFTLVELLVVIGIIAILVSASLIGFSRMRKSAERARALELVMQVKTALESVYDADGIWPKVIRTQSAESDSILNEKVAYYLAKKGFLSVSYDESSGKTTGFDRFGILSPWGVETMKRKGSSCDIGTKVDGHSTIRDHLLRFKVDLDGNGTIEQANVGGTPVNIRAHVAVWCAGKDGIMKPYRQGLKSDDVYSWTPGQTREVP